MKDTLIIVASHKKIDAEKLNAPFIEVYRSESNEFDHTINKIDGVNSPTISWSEYAQFFYPFPLQKNIEVFGLSHYRCILDLSDNNLDLDAKPLSERKDFFEEQLKYIDRYKSIIAVGKPLKFSVSAWQQLLDCEKNIESTLELACKHFDSLFQDGEVDSERILKENNFLYSRNLFVGPKWFAEDWYKISMEIVKYLDGRKPSGVDDRWGGYIIERLFSVYIQMVISKDPSIVITKPIVFFREE